MTKAEAKTVMRIINQVTIVLRRLDAIERDIAAVKKTGVDLININRKLNAENRTLIEAVARVAIRDVKLPIADEVSTHEARMRPITHDSVVIFPLWKCAACKAENASAFINCTICGVGRFVQHHQL